MDQKKIILLIEDESDIRKIYVEVLTEAGYTVKEAADGTQGIQMARNEPWDLMLLDIMLPGQDGIHVLKDLKQVEDLVEKPVLLLTNLENETIIAECFDMGADGYVIKSEITPDYIVTEVKKYIQP